VTVLGLGVGVLLLFANAFFVAVEFALIASRRARLEALAEEGSNRARHALESLRDLNLQLAGAQLGITMASLLLGFVAEPTVAKLIERGIEQFADVPDRLLHTIGFAIALTIVVFLHMVIGEMVPKNIAIASPERTLLALTALNRLYLFLFRPVIRLLNALANAGVRVLGASPRDELVAAHTAEEIANMLGESREEGLIEEMAHQLMTGALDLGERDVASVMVGRAGVVWVPRAATPAEAEEVVVDSGHTRLVVCGDGIDDVLGFVHAKDLLTVPAAARRRPLPLSRIRRMLVLDPGTHLDDALVAMKRARAHLAIVAGEDGRTLGLVTLEDVIEAVVGDIRDESDREPGVTIR
jgi:CBS domain containing-hemolysin-like protein